MNHRKLVIRLALVLAWFLLGTLLFIFNRGHTLIVDNRDLQNQDIRAPDLITVSIDGGKSLEFFRGDRDRYNLGGVNHRIRIEFSDGTAPFEGTFKLPLKDDMYLLSIPRMIHGMEPFVEVFHTVRETRAPEEELPSADEPFFIE
ncbi:hypothetical protein AGMMS49942_24750 [Spirochaetia bacterium]|nr:hypothetical protein AGMMS49942_24750 [Spirochaetia bacterium]